MDIISLIAFLKLLQQAALMPILMKPGQVKQPTSAALVVKFDFRIVYVKTIDAPRSFSDNNKSVKHAVVTKQRHIDPRSS